MSCKLACPVKIQLLHPNAQLPSKAHPDDACFDVVAVSREQTWDYIEYGLGFATEIPPGWEAKFYPRSSISKYDLVLCNSVATIDAGYRGEWKARFKIVSPELAGNFKTYQVGDKVGQISFQRVPQVSFEVVEALSDSERATGSFGSTGR